MTKQRMTPHQLSHLLAAANYERAEAGLPPLTAEVWAPLVTTTEPTPPTPDQTFAALSEAHHHLRETEQDLTTAITTGTSTDIRKAEDAARRARTLFAEAREADIAAARAALEDAEAEHADMQAKADRLRELTTPPAPSAPSAPTLDELTGAIKEAAEHGDWRAVHVYALELATLAVTNI